MTAGAVAVELGVPFVRMDSSPSTCGAEGSTKSHASAGRPSLRSMVLGGALGDAPRRVVETRDIDAHLAGIAALIETGYGSSRESKHAAREFEQLIAMNGDAAGLACKRAALLYALHKEPLVQRHFRDAGDAHAIDLIDRVLPLTVPRFVRHGCQSPDAFVQLCVILMEMWPGEPLGNWPSKRVASRA